MSRPLTKLHTPAPLVVATTARPYKAGGPRSLANADDLVNYLATLFKLACHPTSGSSRALVAGSKGFASVCKRRNAIRIYNKKFACVAKFTSSGLLKSVTLNIHDSSRGKLSVELDWTIPSSLFTIHWFCRADLFDLNRGLICVQDRHVTRSMIERSPILHESRNLVTRPKVLLSCRGCISSTTYVYPKPTIMVLDLLGHCILLPCQLCESLDAFHHALLQRSTGNDCYSFIQRRMYDVTICDQTAVLESKTWPDRIRPGTVLELSAIVLVRPWVDMRSCPICGSTSLCVNFDPASWTKCMHCDVQFRNVAVEYDANGPYHRLRICTDLATTNFDVSARDSKNAFFATVSEASKLNVVSKCVPQVFNASPLPQFSPKVRGVRLLTIEDDDKLYENTDSSAAAVMPHIDVLQKQSLITWEARLSAVDDMLRIQLYHDLPLECVWIAVNVLDRFLCDREIKTRSVYKAMCLAALLIGCKFDGFDDRTWLDNALSNEYMSRSNVMLSELEILSALNFNISDACSPYNWIRRICKAADFDEHINALAELLSLLALVNHDFQTFTPRTIAAVAAYTARRINGDDWSSAFVYYSGFTENQLKCGFRKMLETLPHIEFKSPSLFKRFCRCGHLPTISTGQDLLDSDTNTTLFDSYCVE